MEKMWAGRFSKELDEKVNEFNSSLNVDKRMFEEDILGSQAHAQMLADCKIINADSAKKIIDALSEILQDIKSKKLTICGAEDIHMFVEAILTKRIGEEGKMLHTARSRNDQVALDLRLYCKKEINKIILLLKELVKTILNTAEENADTLMCGYTHLQKAQPINFAHHILAYAFMFLRDITRLNDCKARLDLSPLGCCALAGTTHPIDRQATANALGFSGVVENSIDGVSDRDFAIELCFDISVIMMHLSRFCEEVVLWCSWEFKYLELDDAYATGSSIMPQKKNPDVAELIRGKSGRSYGNLVALLTTMKALPLAYNKDMQEDKEALFDSIDTVKICVEIFSDMLRTSTVLEDNMEKGLEGGFTNATDLADYLAKEGIPFRAAYKISGEIVAYCLKNKKTLNTMTLPEYKSFCDKFESDIYDAIDLKSCVEKRTSEGGPSKESIEKQIASVKTFLENN